MSIYLSPGFGFQSREKYEEYCSKIARNIGASSNEVGARRLGLVMARVDVASKVLGYIPVVGSGVGVWRLYKMVDAGDGNAIDRKQKIGRAVVEILSAGILLAPVDLTVHVIRKYFSVEGNG